jgi:hypothetical protein
MKMKTRLKDLFFLFCALLCCIFSPLSAAGPVTHALLADHFFRIYPDKYDDVSKAAFRAGTLFPDIRYICHLSREDTHFDSVTIEDVFKEPSPFIAGMKFHSLVDKIRENFVINGGYYELLSSLNIEHSASYLKLLEDEIAYPSVDKGPWKEIVKAVHPDEEQWSVDPESLKKWHYLLDLSFSYYPSTLLFFAHLRGNGLLTIPASEVAIWYDTFENMSQSPEIKTYVNDLFQMFSSKLQKK